MTRPEHVCTRPPGENFDHRLGHGPCDCIGCVRSRADEAPVYTPASSDPDHLDY